jgi:hypothetical protein
MQPGSPPKAPKPTFIKHTFFIFYDMNILGDLPFSRNQPLKSADDQCIRILKNKLIKLKIKKAGHCD